MNLSRAALLSALLLSSTAIHADLPPPTYSMGTSGSFTFALGSWWPSTYLTEVRFADSDAPAAGVSFRYRTDPACGTFAYGAESTGVVYDGGLAESLPFSGVALAAACPVWFHADGMAEEVAVAVRIFDPATVVLTASTAVADAVYGQYFTFSVDAMAEGVPVGAYPMQYEIGSSPSGATASFFREGCGLNTARCYLGFQANARPGNYPIRVSYGNSSVTIEVKQRPN